MSDDTYIKIVLPISVAIISGLLALIGGFLGAWLTRRTEYSKWLRQERSIAFAEFIKKLNDTSLEAINILSSPDTDKGDIDLSVTKLFCQLNGPENVVRLYLDEADRDDFSQLVKEYWILHSPRVAIERRIKDGKLKLEMIQKILEKSLHH